MWRVRSNGHFAPSSRLTASYAVDAEASEPMCCPGSSHQVSPCSSISYDPINNTDPLGAASGNPADLFGATALLETDSPTTEAGVEAIAAGGITAGSVGLALGASSVGIAIGVGFLLNDFSESGGGTMSSGNAVALIFVAILVVAFLCFMGYVMWLIAAPRLRGKK